LEYDENERTRKVLREKSLGGNANGRGGPKKKIQGKMYERKASKNNSLRTNCH
jgi:hypothetical protein